MDSFSSFHTHIPEPHILFHGTDRSSAHLIQVENLFKASKPIDHGIVVYGKYRGVYLTADRELAEEYAGKDGVIFRLNGMKLAMSYTLLRIAPRVYCVTSDITNARSFIL